MVITQPLLDRHSLDVNHIIIEYIQKYKDSSQKAADFLKKVTNEFEAKIKQAGANTLARSTSIDIHYILIVGIKNINALSLQNLKAALLRVTK